MVVKKRQFPIKIGPFTYIVLFDNAELALRDRDKGGDSTYGEIVFETGMIYIRHDMESSFEKETVLHEINHGVMNICGLFDEQIPKVDNEWIVRTTSPVWLQIWTDPLNKEFRDYILEGV